MKKLLIVAIIVVVGIFAVSTAGSAFETFADSLDLSSGVMGSGYNADK